MPEISTQDLQALTARLQAAIAQVQGNHQAMSAWSTSQDDTVSFTDDAGSTMVVPTLDKLNRDFAGLETDVRALIGDLYARPISEFYAERERNLALYRASGMVHMGQHNAAAATVNQGLTAPANTPNEIFLGRYTSNIGGTSECPHPVTVVAGLVSQLNGLNDTPSAYSPARVKFPAAPDGKTTYNRSTGEVVTHSSVDAAFDAAAINPDVEVVTERVDMYGLEMWLEAITPENPWVYPNGLIQSKATSMDGVATGSSTRPDSYYAVFIGDTTSRGKPVNLFAASAAEQAKLLANPDNGIYRLADGSLVQKHLAQRTFVGPGNGDWGAGSVGIDSTQARYLGFAGGVLVSAQGARDTAPGGSLYESQLQGYEGFKGTFKAVTAGKPDAGAGVNGECYFLVLGTRQCLNSGHYHPSHNDLGTAIPHINNDPVQGGVLWHDARANHLDSARACFTALKRYDGTIGGGTGHPSGRFNNAVYPGGYGGVVDLRLEARQQSQADHARVDGLVKSGQYRGLETVKRTYVSSHDATAAAPSGPVPGHNYVLLAAGVRTGAAVGRPYYVVNGDTNEVAQVTAASALDGPRHPNLYFPSAWGAPSVVYSIQAADTGLSVSGAFTHLTVIGNPANIAQCAALAGGWLGDWCPVIPDATTKVYPFGRKLISTGSLTYTSDNGASWNSITGHGVGWNESTNSKTVASGPNDVGIHTYTAWANMTEPCANALLRDGEAGISGTVFQQMRSAPTAGALLTASLIGKVPTDNGSGYTYGNLSYLGGSVFLGKLYPSRMPHRHEPVSLRKPLNSSPASKSLRYSHVDAGLVTNCYAYAELRFDPDYDSANDFGSLIQPDHSQAWNAGQKYRIQTDDGVICVVCVNSHNGAQFQNFTQLPTGEWSISTGVVYFRPWYGPAAGWGDSGEMPIVDNNGTWLDDNGHTLRAGTHKLALPFGWA